LLLFAQRTQTGREKGNLPLKAAETAKIAIHGKTPASAFRADAISEGRFLPGKRGTGPCIDKFPV